MKYGNQKAYPRKRHTNAKRTICKREHLHPSGLEASVCDELLLEEEIGKLKLIAREELLHLGPQRFIYKPDFTLFDLETNEKFWAEAKGREDLGPWRRNYRTWKAGFGPGRLRIYKQGKYGPVMTEELIAKVEICPYCMGTGKK